MKKLLGLGGSADWRVPLSVYCVSGYSEPVVNSGALRGSLNSKDLSHQQTLREPNGPCLEVWNR